MEANIESDEPPKRIYRLLETAHASCFTESTMMAVKITIAASDRSQSISGQAAATGIRRQTFCDICRVPLRPVLIAMTELLLVFAVRPLRLSE